MRKLGASTFKGVMREKKLAPEVRNPLKSFWIRPCNFPEHIFFIRCGGEVGCCHFSSFFFRKGRKENSRSSSPSKKGKESPSSPSKKGNQSPTSPSKKGKQSPTSPSKKGKESPTSPSKRGKSRSSSPRKKGSPTSSSPKSPNSPKKGYLTFSILSPKISHNII